jgi:murein DD-endopeptidase MepM/ murein hydrolase activator NlpD
MLELFCPFLLTPDWGAFLTPAQWDRTYSQYTVEEMVPIPAYDLKTLTTPAKDLLSPRNTEALTAKIYYSTRYMGTYDLDAGEHTGFHDGVDFQQPLGTPVRAISGGRVKVRKGRDLGTYIVIEHGAYRWTYAHLDETTKRKRVKAGQVIGTVGMTGNTDRPHLHLSVMKNWRSVNPMSLLPCR